jgi:hypothetical protein
MSLNKLIYSSRPEKSNIIDILNKMLAHRPLQMISVHEDVICRKTRKRKRKRKKRKRKTKKKGWFSF